MNRPTVSRCGDRLIIAVEGGGSRSSESTTSTAAKAAPPCRRRAPSPAPAALPAGVRLVYVGEREREM
ncbi:hypothetical protein Hanom_Chr17g01586021 [Helianthus anomalus]